MLHNTGIAQFVASAMYVGTAALNQLRIYNSLLCSYDSLPTIILGHLNVVGVYGALNFMSILYSSIVNTK